MYLENKAPEQKMVIEQAIITEKGRIYMNEILGEKNVDYDTAIKTVFPNYGENYGEMKYEYLKYNTLPTTLLQGYITISDSFMAFLIDNRIVDWNQAIARFSSGLSLQDVHSLLKPVFVRYNLSKNNPDNLIKIRSNIGVKRARKITLYDVSVILQNSYLRLLDNFSIDLTEEEFINNSYNRYKCVYLGKIRKFNKVEIEMDDNFIRKITLSGYGYY
ncbi:MAG: hypothetical protein ACRC8M_13580 [Cetobacterium sp.]|uniref:hypothetical protein n=1 Tax=Cetobacterium sp. TaxID=2071632 RepID=UPI003F2D0775